MPSSTYRPPLEPGPGIMGILNVTPDSFSDEGAHSDLTTAVAHARSMIEDGANIIDIGPESTRPGAADVPAAEQIRRAIPAIERLRESHPNTPISIDTRLAEVARSALRAGADFVNDVSALRDDPNMAEAVAESSAGLILMHRRGDARSMQQDGGPRYADVVSEVKSFLIERMHYAMQCGIIEDRIWLDPGIGFGKRIDHNLMILRRLSSFFELGRPIVVGASRKSFIGAVCGIDDPRRRDPGSLACAVMATLAAFEKGARVREPSPSTGLLRRASEMTPTLLPNLILRVHDISGTVQAVNLCKAIVSVQ